VVACSPVPNAMPGFRMMLVLLGSGGSSLQGRELSGASHACLSRTADKNDLAFPKGDASLEGDADARWESPLHACTLSDASHACT
jgi:hypothetical protein